MSDELTVFEHIHSYDFIIYIMCRGLVMLFYLPRDQKQIKGMNSKSIVFHEFWLGGSRFPWHTKRL